MTKGDQSQLNWEVLYGTRHPYKAEILKGVLEENEIQSVIVNKQDSAYLVIGEIEVYVQRDDMVKAVQILKKFLSDE